MAHEPSAQPALLPSTIFEWSRLAVLTTANGQRRDLFDSPTVTLAGLESHVTTIDAGRAAHAPHRHADEELVFVKEGTLEVSINGKTQRAGAGSVIFYASNDLHGMRNAGETPATYYVLRWIARPVDTAEAGPAHPAGSAGSA